MVLEMIRKENDIRKLNEEQLRVLADEIRQFLIEKISATGGHLASNLGFPSGQADLGCGTSVLHPQTADRQKRRI